MRTIINVVTNWFRLHPKVEPLRAEALYLLDHCPACILFRACQEENGGLYGPDCSFGPHLNDDPNIINGEAIR